METHLKFGNVFVCFLLLGKFPEVGAQRHTRCKTSQDCQKPEDLQFCDEVFYACMKCDDYCTGSDETKRHCLNKCPVRYMVVYDNHEVGKDKLPEKKEIIPRKKETKTVNEETYPPRQLVHQQHETTADKEGIGRNDLIAIVVGCVAAVILTVTALVGLYYLVWKKTRVPNRQPAMHSSIGNDCNVTDSNVRMISLHEHRTQTNKGAVCETKTHQHLLEVVEQKV